MTGGWVKLYRQIMDHHLWRELPFDKKSAWIDLILLANHKPGKIRRRGILIEVKTGEVGYSLRELSKRWGWSLGKVQRFINELKTGTQIDTRTDTENINVTNLIRLTNYEKYQSCDTENDTATDTKSIRRRVQNKNVKNDKTNTPSNFVAFWAAYPRKVGKASALKSWQKINPDSSLQAKILKSLEWQSQQPDWLKENGKFTPHPATWLNGRRWEDEQPKESFDIGGYYR